MEATFTYTAPATGRATTAGVVATALGPLWDDHSLDLHALDALPGWHDLQVEGPAAAPSCPAAAAASRGLAPA